MGHQVAFEQLNTETICKIASSNREVENKRLIVTVSHKPRNQWYTVFDYIKKTRKNTPTLRQAIAVYNAI